MEKRTIKLAITLVCGIIAMAALVFSVYFDVRGMESQEKTANMVLLVTGIVALIVHRSSRATKK